MAPVRRIDSVGGRIGGAQCPVAEKPIGAAVISVGAALGNGVHDAARGAPVFRQEVAGHHLEFLDGILRDVVGAGAAGVLVVESIGGIDAVVQEGIASWISAKSEQP